MTASTPVQELRLVLTVKDYDRAKAYYQDLLGRDAVQAWESPEGRVIILEAGRATLELVDEQQAAVIDQVEVGRRVSGTVRLALGFGDVTPVIERATGGGGTLVNPTVVTPWGSRNARVIAPDGMQVTLFADAKPE